MEKCVIDEVLVINSKGLELKKSLHQGYPDQIK
jgi:hypothetical protein